MKLLKESKPSLRPGAPFEILYALPSRICKHLFHKPLLICVRRWSTLKPTANKNMFFKPTSNMFQHMYWHMHRLFQLSNHYEQDSHSFGYTSNQYEFKTAWSEQMFFICCAVLSGPLFLVEYVLQTLCFACWCLQCILLLDVFERCVWEMLESSIRHVAWDVPVRFLQSNRKDTVSYNAS
jgi:hypothetical protein